MIIASVVNLFISAFTCVHLQSHFEDSHPEVLLLVFIVKCLGNQSKFLMLIVYVKTHLFLFTTSYRTIFNTGKSVQK